MKIDGEHHLQPVYVYDPEAEYIHVSIEDIVIPGLMSGEMMKIDQVCAGSHSFDFHTEIDGKVHCNYCFKVIKLNEQLTLRDHLM